MRKILLLLLMASGCMQAQNSVDSPIVELSDDGSKIYRTPEVDVKPEVKGGNYHLSLYTSQNLKMPDVHNKKVKIFVGFVVEVDGTISNVKFIYMSVKDIDEAKAKLLTDEQKKRQAAQLDAMKTESVRLLTQFKEPWKPAMRAGKPVRCQYNYPINFSLE